MPQSATTSLANARKRQTGSFLFKNRDQQTSAGLYAFLTAFCHRFLLQPGATMLRLDVFLTSINGLRGAAVVKQIAANWVFLKVWQPPRCRTRVHFTRLLLASPPRQARDWV